MCRNSHHNERRIGSPLRIRTGKTFEDCLYLQVLSARPDLYYVTFIGQSVVAVSQIFVLSVPAQLAATWFPATQVPFQ